MAQLGIRNNNWLNVRYSPNNNWLGQTGSDSSDYAQFENPAYGIRAADKVLENYKNIHGIDTVADAIGRYAPPSDNNPTDNYINYVSNRLGVEPYDSIDLSNPNTRESLMQAMVGFETPDAASQFTPELLAEARGISAEQASPSIIQRRPSPPGRRTFLVTDRVSGKQLRVSGNRAPTESDLENLFQPYRSASAGDRTIIGQIGETGKAIPRGFARGILSSVEGLAEMADAATNFIGLDNLIDSGDENELVRLARSGQESLNEGFMGADEAYQDAWLTKFGEGLGSMGAFLTPGGVARLAGITGKSLRSAEGLGAGSLATTMYAGEQAERIKMARESGIEVSEDQEDLAVALGAITGLTELAPVYRLFSRIPKVAGYTFGQQAMRNITESIKSGGVEAIQEGTGLWLQNAIERGVYNENLPKGESMWDEFTVGGAVGMTADLLLRAFSGRRAAHSTEIQISREAALRESLKRDMAKLPAMLSREQAKREATALAEKSDLSAEDKEKVVSQVLEELQPDNNVTLKDMNSASIVDSLDMSGESYSHPIFKKLYEIGMSVLNPEAHNITSAHIDHAAKTTNDYGFAEGLSLEELESQGIEEKRFTASQKYNIDRKNRGLDEVSTFTPAEAKKILRDNFNNLPSIIRTEDREQYSAEKDSKGNDYVLSTAGEQIRSRRVAADGSFEPIANRRQALALAARLNKHEGFLVPPEVIKTIRGSKKDLRRILKEKNISSSIDSPEIQYLAEKMTGEPDVNKMTAADRKIFYNRLRKLPRLDKLTKLPLLRRRSYTKTQWDKALSEVKRSGDPRLKNIQRAARLRGKHALRNAKAIRKEMVEQGVIVKNKVVSYEKGKSAVAAGEAAAKKSRKARKKVPNKLLEPLIAALEKSLKSIGLGDVSLRVTEELEYALKDSNDNMVVGARVDNGKLRFDDTPTAEALYEPNIKTILMGLDKVALKDTAGNPLTEEQILDQLLDLLNHETVHAFRNLDLFTENEWFILENAARTLARRDVGGTFYEVAQEVYSDQSPVIQMEEAIADLIRHGRRDPKLVGGKPRNLIQRVIDFLERIYSSMRGTGFQSYGDIIASLERGDIGARSRGEVRTLLLTELSAKGAPERGIGLSEEEKEEDLKAQEERREQAKEAARMQEVIGMPTAEQPAQDQADFPAAPAARESRAIRIPGFDEGPAYRQASDLPSTRNRIARELQDAGIGGEFGIPLYEITDSDLSSFSKEGRGLMRALRKDDWLGFDSIDDLMIAIFDENVNEYDPSLATKRAIGRYVNLNFGDAALEPDTKKKSRIHTARESRAISRIEDRIESGTVDDYVVLETDPDKQEEIRSFFRGRRTPVPLGARESRHVTAHYMWDQTIGVMTSSSYTTIDGTPLEFDRLLNEFSSLALGIYVKDPLPFAVPKDSPRSKILADVLDLSEPVWSIDQWPRGKQILNNFVRVDKNKLFQSLIDDLITNNKPYRKVIQERLSEAGVPSTFTVYRGRPGKSPRGYGKWNNDLVASVSTNRLFAQEFAPLLEEPVIDSYTIGSDDILALGAINEGELIIRLPKSPDSTTDANSQEEESLFMSAESDARRNAQERHRARIEPEAGQLPPGLFSAAESRPIDPYEISTRLNKKGIGHSYAGADALINYWSDYLEGTSAKGTAMGAPKEKGKRHKRGAIKTLPFYRGDAPRDYKGLSEWLADFAKDNILFIYDRVPEEIREVTRRWYDGANLYANRLAEEKGISVPQAAGVIAALSPQQEWDINVSLAERVIDIYKNEQNTVWTDEMLSTYERIFLNDGIKKKSIVRNRRALEAIKDKTFAEVLANESDVNASIWLRTYDETYNDKSHRTMFPGGYFLDYARTKGGDLKSISWRSLPPITNAIRVLQDTSVDNITRNLGKGNKVRNFYNNILNPNSTLHHVTIDTHAVAAAYMMPLGAKDYEVGFAFGTQKIPTGIRTPKTASIANDTKNGFYGVYPIIEEAYRRAAKERGIFPREMQSVVWEAGRSIFPAAYKTEKAKKEVQTLWEDYGKRKELDVETVRERIYGHSKSDKAPEYWRSYLGSLEEIQRAVDAGELPGSSFSRSAEEPALGRGTRGYGTGLAEAEGLGRPEPDPLPVEGVEEVVAQNARESREVRAGLVPRFSQNASPEAQYVARNPDEGTPLSDAMKARYSRKLNVVGGGGYVDQFAGDELPDSHPMNAFMDAANIHGWDRFKMWMTKIKQSTINNWARLEAISQDPLFRDMYGSSSAMAAALMASRSRGLVASALKFGVIVYEGGVMRVVNEKLDSNGNPITGLMDGMVPLYSNVHNTNLEKLAKAYAIANREIRLDKEGKIIRVSAKERDAAMKEIKEKIDRYRNPDTGNPIVEEWYKWWQDYNSHTITWLKNTGVIDAKAAENWAAFSDYSPFYEEAKNTPNIPDHLNICSGMTGTTDFDPVKGSTSALNMPMLEAVTRNLSAAIDMGMKNVAQQRIVRDQLKLNMARDITDNKHLHTKTFNVVFKVDGEKKVYEIYDPLLHESLKAMGQGDLPWIINNIFGTASQILRETVTKDPAFMLVNMMRDTMSAYVTSGSNFIPVIDTVKGFAGGDMKALEMLGVVGGYDFSNDPKDIVKFMKRLAAKRGTPIGSIRRKGEFDLLGSIEDGFEDPILKPFKTLWQGLGAVTTRSDAATRWAVYEDVLERTGDLGEAQIQGLEIINFSRRGNSPIMRSLTAAIPFLNARMQGVDVLYRAFTGRYGANKEMQKTQVVKTAVFRGSLLLATTYMYWMLVSDEDEYKDARPEVKDDYFLIPLTSLGIDEVMRLPIPFEVGVIFKTIPERIFEASMGDDVAADVSKSITRAITNTLEINPFQAQAVGPIIEAWMNHDFYTGRSVVPLYMDQDVARGLQDTFGTRELAVKIGQALNISPIKIDHIMTGYAGTLGVYGLDVIDFFLRSEGRIPPERRLDQYPVIKRFFASPRGGGLQEKFYELSNEIREMVTTMNRLNRQGRYDELNAFVKTRQGLMEIRENVNYVSKRMAEYRLKRDIIQRSNLDPATKRERLEILEAEAALMLRVAPELKRIANLPFLSRIR